MTGQEPPESRLPSPQTMGRKTRKPSKNGGPPPQRTFREFQFIVVPVLLVEEEGGVPFTQQADQIVCRGLAELQEVIDRFPRDLEQLNNPAVQ